MRWRWRRVMELPQPDQTATNSPIQVNIFLSHPIYSSTLRRAQKEKQDEDFSVQALPSPRQEVQADKLL